MNLLILSRLDWIYLFLSGFVLNLTTEQEGDERERDANTSLGCWQISFGCPGHFLGLGSSSLNCKRNRKKHLASFILKFLKVPNLTYQNRLRLLSKILKFYSFETLRNWMVILVNSSPRQSKLMLRLAVELSSLKTTNKLYVQLQEKYWSFLKTTSSYVWSYSFVSISDCTLRLSCFIGLFSDWIA